MNASVSATDLGTTVCRALMRDMADQPIRLDIFVGYPSTFSITLHGAAAGYEYERTPAAARRIVDQWTVTLLPTGNFVTVRANGKYWGMGIWDDLDIGGVNDITPTCDYVRYPGGYRESPKLIATHTYTNTLRAVIERALAVVEAEHARAQAGDGAR